MGLHKASTIKRINPESSTTKRVATGGVLGALIVGGVVVAGAQNDVTVDFNGELTELTTLSRDVSGALEAAGVEVGAEDLVYPAPSESLKKGETITVRTAKPVAVVIDGKPTDITSTALTVEDLIGELDGVTPAANIAEQGNTRVTDGMRLDITTPRIVSFNDGGKIVHTQVAAATVGDFLESREIELGEHDTITPALDSALQKNAKVEITRVDIAEESAHVEFDAKPTYVDNPDAAEGTEEVLEEGEAGIRDVTHRITTVNGVEKSREIISEVEVRPSVGATIARGTKPAAPSVSNGGVWDTLAQCESGGDWSINTGNGYHGGLQFSASTWSAFGGGQYASTADQASREQQIDIASRVQEGQGWGAWPACTSSMGLR